MGRPMLLCGHRARNSHQLERKVVPMIVNTSDVVAIIGIVLAAFELGFLVGQAKK